MNLATDKCVLVEMRHKVFDVYSVEHDAEICRRHECSRSEHVYQRTDSHITTATSHYIMRKNRRREVLPMEICNADTAIDVARCFPPQLGHSSLRS
jgi:hypothetical protein